MDFMTLKIIVLEKNTKVLIIFAFFLFLVYLLPVLIKEKV